MKINSKTSTPAPRTAQGGLAARIGPEQGLLRSTMSCMLWDGEFYESGETIAKRIGTLIPQCSTEFVAATAFYARTTMKLRHVPLLIVREMARHPAHKKVVKDLLRDVIQRPDELTEFLAIYWKDGKQPLSAQVKKGLGAAFRKFDEYDLAKYNRDNDIKLRDVLFLSHSKPIDAQNIRKAERAVARKAGGKLILETHEDLYRRLVDDELATPDTWEVALSGLGKATPAEKKEVWTRLLNEKKLGALAFLRNLRNMHEAGIDGKLVAEYSATVKVDRVLPFRFIAAARYAPQWEPMLESMMFRCLEGAEKLPGKTKLLVDVSGSMEDKLSGKSEMLRLDAAYGLGVLLREICEDVEIHTFSNNILLIPPRRGFALRDAMEDSQHHGGTYLGRAVTEMNKTPYDRLIVITDEQSADRVPDPLGRGYVINVASNKNGIGYGKWLHIDGFSEACVDFIRMYEKEAAE